MKIDHLDDHFSMLIIKPRIAVITDGRSMEVVLFLV